MSHTPAPWKWDGEYPIEILGDNAKVVVCSGLMPAQADDVLLICAAPDLLAALQLIATGCEDGESFSGTYCGDIARAAIAKATGA